ncbi:nuclear transport factor 2 family protein [Planktotalea sp.]|uniref:nuclear transport factor 2 family protein n=1 Tax=Planktotalea sp. TaxID=2029877 RepID=UPI003D6B9453
MTFEGYKAFVQDWQDAWNAHDLPRILSHYSDDITFRSAKAVALVGDGEVVGKAALAAYWAEALSHQPDLHFKVLEIFNGHNMLVILYENHKQVRATETLMFDDSGLVFLASACHA